jgi:hypothetical protein
MRFSGNGLYIEEYVKCANCGVLIYEVDLPNAVEIEDEGLFCSQWCIDWARARDKRREKHTESP